MYTCPKCKKFASVGPGTCWKCGKKLVDPEPPPEVATHITLRLRLRQPHRILFVGAIDGGPELEFLTYLRWPSCVAYITSYQVRPPELEKLNEESYGSANILTLGRVDATNLVATFQGVRFDAIVWIGPTNDEKLSLTSNLVGAFVDSAAAVLAQGGVVFVVQDLKTPNFRPILKLPGAFFCCDLALSGRTQTQHSSKKKVMEGRSDQLVAFTFTGYGVRQPNDQGNTDFIDIITNILSVPRKMWEGRYSKKEIIDMIFGFANNMVEEQPRIRLSVVEERAPSGIYKCPKCKNFARVGPGACWKCGAKLQAQ